VQGVKVLFASNTQPAQDLSASRHAAQQSSSDLAAMPKSALNPLPPSAPAQATDLK